MTTHQVKVGQRVRIVKDTPDGTPVEGIVRIVQDVKGKEIGVWMDLPSPNGHALDHQLKSKLLSPKPTLKLGWWTTKNNIEAI